MADQEKELLGAQARMTATMGVGLRVGAALMQMSSDRCPSAEDIARLGMLSPEIHISSRDVWGTPYRITCRGSGAPIVTSAGPDLTFDTGDDIVIDDL